eukprot:TRINITY_DN7536_c0_g1_i1.p1 TRINITY_DN7536_c0_g1~~TRINITY_DN7536_c0_g1_i1.p1  ORF type:complete len:375 (+),score=56.99 TRINITY_DN7536_c0_g1_i1:113-1237(+)
MAGACVTYEAIAVEDDLIFIDKLQGRQLTILGRPFAILEDDEASKRAVLNRMAAILWFTYRKTPYPIAGRSHLKADTGWGCTFRVAQMVMAEALQRLHNGHHDYHNAASQDVRLTLLKRFEDRPDRPYSIHRLATHGKQLGKKPGSWVTPTDAAHCLRLATNSVDDRELNVFVAMDSLLIMETLVDQCLRSQPTLVLIPLRLGIEKLDANVFESLKMMFQSPYSVGAIGGRPGSAFFFIGYSDDNLLHMDPHTTQPALEADMQGALLSCQRTTSDILPMANADPTICLAFLFKSPDELAKFYTFYQHIQSTGPALFSMVQHSLALGTHASKLPLLSYPEIISLWSVFCMQALTLPYARIESSPGCGCGQQRRQF